VDVVVTTTGGSTGPLDFSYVAAPVTAAINPGFGPMVGGTAVTVTGTGFVAGQTTVTIGGGTIPAAEGTVNGTGTAAQFTTPAHAAGTVEVDVTTPGGPAGPLAFAYLPVPVADSISSTSGPAEILVEIRRSGFIPGNTVVGDPDRDDPAVGATAGRRRAAGEGTAVHCRHRDARG
jgi:hypothetical protein